MIAANRHCVVSMNSQLDGEVLLGSEREIDHKNQSRVDPPTKICRPRTGLALKYGPLSHNTSVQYYSTCRTAVAHALVEDRVRSRGPVVGLCFRHFCIDNRP
jgi:hypothetical protein